jgi:hypothetical protein
MRSSLFFVVLLFGIEFREQLAKMVGRLLLFGFVLLPQGAPNRTNGRSPKHELFFCLLGHYRATERHGCSFLRSTEQR